MDESADKVAGLNMELIDLTDETLMSTPVPQATSTAQRNIACSMEVPKSADVGEKSVLVGSQLQGAVDDLQDLHEQLKAFSIGRSTASSCSSVGLLPPNTLSDFSAASIGTSEVGASSKAAAEVVNDLALDLNMRMQRALALQSVERSTAFHSGQQEAGQYTTVNLDSTNDSVLNEIAARIERDWAATSSIQGSEEPPPVPNSHSLAGGSEHDFNVQNSLSIANSTNMADMEELVDKYGEEEFLSQEAGYALLAKDEEQFRKEVPPIHEIPSHSSISMDFSAVRDESHITVGSPVLNANSHEQKNKLSIGQFFSLRTEKIPSLGFQHFNDVHHGLHRVDTVTNLNARSDLGSDADTSDVIVNSSTSSVSSSAVPSASKIQEILFQLSNSLSGSVIVDEMMKGFRKRPRETSTKVLQDTSNFLNSAAPVSEKESVHKTVSSKNEIIAEMNNRDDDDGENLEIIYQQIRTSQKRSEQKKKREAATRNMRSSTKSQASVNERNEDFVPLKENCVLKDSTSQLNLDESVVCVMEAGNFTKPSKVLTGKSSAGEHRRKRDVARWVAQTSTEHSDISFEVRSRRKGSTNLVELADPNPQENVKDGINTDWVTVLPTSMTEFVLAVGVLSPVLLKFKASSKRLLVCHVAVKGAEVMGSLGKLAPVEVELPDTQMTIFPETEQQLQAWIRPKEAIRMRIITNIILKDVSTSETHIIPYSFLVCGEEPKVLLCLGENSENGKMDFGLIAENCCVSRNISLENKSDVFLALALELEQEEIKHNGNSYQAFSLLEDNSLEQRSFLQVFLREQSDPKDYCQAAVQFHPPRISDDSPNMIHRAKLVVKFDIPNTQVVLKQLTVIGRSFHVRMSGRHKPVTITVSRRDVAAHKTVNIMKNLGTETIQIKLWLEGVEKDVVQVRPGSLQLEASQAARVTILFNPLLMAASDSVITGFLKSQILPGGQVHSIPVNCCVETAQSADVVHGEGGVSGRPLSISSESCESSSRVSGGSDGTQSRSQLQSQPSISSRKPPASPLKLEASYSALSCESLGVGRKLKLSTTIRNYATHSYKLRLSVSSQGGDFKMINDNGEAVVSRVLKIHAMECKVLKFQFTSTQVGAAVGTVLHHQLAPVNSETQKKIVLYGYGGNAKIKLSLSRDASGKMWLNMGEATNPGQILVHNIVITNKGTIPGFVIFVNLFEGSRMLYDNTALTMSPAAVVVQPQQSEIVRVEYRLSRNDLASFTKSGKVVCEVATIGLILGDEPTRQRLRRLMEDNCEGSVADIKSKVCSTFTKEVPIHDIVDLKDSKDASKRFCESFTTHVVSVTVESSKDNTSVSRIRDDYTMGEVDRSDTTNMFMSLLQDTAPAQPRLEQSPTHGEQADAGQPSWNVQPRVVTLQLPQITSAMLTLWNNHATCQLFEVAITEDWLEVEPREGAVSPHCKSQLRLAMPRWPSHADQHDVLQTNVMVYIENDCILVKVMARFTEPRPLVQPQAVSTPLQVHSRPHPVGRVLVLDRQDLALPPVAVGHVSSAAINCTNMSHTQIQVEVCVSQPFFVSNSRLIIPPQSCQALLVYFSPTKAELIKGHALLMLAQEKQVVLLIGKGIE